MIISRNTPFTVHRVEVGQDGIDELPRTFHEVQTVLGVHQKETCWPFTLELALTNLKHLLIVCYSNQKSK